MKCKTVNDNEKTICFLGYGTKSLLEWYIPFMLK